MAPAANTHRRAACGRRGSRTTAISSTSTTQNMGSVAKPTNLERRNIACNGTARARRAGEVVQRGARQLLHRATAGVARLAPATAALQPGDLVSFHGQGHVGLYLGEGLYVHSTKAGDVVRVHAIADRSDLDGFVRLG